MVKQQPEALRLADALEDDLTRYDGLSIPGFCQNIANEAAVELRHLHEINKELLQALKALQHSLDYEDLLHDDQRAAYCKALELIEQQEEPNV